MDGARMLMGYRGHVICRLFGINALPANSYRNICDSLFAPSSLQTVEETRAYKFIPSAVMAHLLGLL